jgi:hypothetical protein
LRLLLGVEGKDQYKKVLCQFCVNLIGTSWHLVTQHATSGLYVYYKVVTVEKALSLRGIEAPKTLANFLERKTQLYEQGADVRRSRRLKIIYSTIIGRQY